MKFTKNEKAAFNAAGEPRSEPDYSAEISRLLSQKLTPEQEDAVLALLLAFGSTVQYERRWYFYKGWLAGKREALR